MIHLVGAGLKPAPTGLIHLNPELLPQKLCAGSRNQVIPPPAPSGQRPRAKDSTSCWRVSFSQSTGAGASMRGFRSIISRGSPARATSRCGAPKFPQTIQHFLDRDLIEGQLGQELGG